MLNDFQEQVPRARHPWLPWIIGFALLTAVVIAVSHISEETEFLNLARDAQPSWLLAALLLQAFTYWAQAKIWCGAARGTNAHIPLSLAYKLSLAKLFIDQALPSAGLSGTVVVAEVLERGLLPRPAIRAGVILNTTSFFIAYVIALVMSIGILFFFGEASSVIIVPCAIFAILAGLLVVAMWKLSGRNLDHGPGWILRYNIVRNSLSILENADPQLVRNFKLQAEATAYQMLTFLLDGVTLWMLLRSLGEVAPPGYVFASFMVANLVRTVSIVPGGLGTFEAAAVLMLGKIGIPVAAALSTALLFRGMTFFLPMVPGMWYSRRLMREVG